MRAVAALRALAEAGDELGQALAVLDAAGAGESERMSLAAGDRRVLELHRELTGEDLELTVACPACGTVNSAMLAPDALPPLRPRSAWWGAGGGLREPTYRDLRELPGDDGDAAAELLRRCTVGTPPRPATAAELELIDDSLTGPLVLACSECEQPLEARVDVERAALESLERRLETVEGEIHRLAAAYHWPLAEIEALPDERRSRLARFVSDGA